MDVHARSCTLAVLSQSGKRLRDWVVETNGQALIEAIRTIPGRKHLCIEEGTQSAWLYEILKPHVYELIVATVPKRRGSKSDKADAYQRAEELLRGTIERTVFKSPRTYARLRELARSHRTTVRDRVGVQARLKTVYRSRGIPTSGPALCGVRQRSEWLEQLPAPCKQRALHLYTHLDFLVEQERTIEVELLKQLSKQHNAELKAIFKGAATTVITGSSETPMKVHYRRMLENGTKPNLAKLTLARKIGSTALRMWKDEEVYRAQPIKGSTTRALDS